MKNSILILFLGISIQTAAQTIIPLYPGPVPNSKPYAMKEVRMEANGLLVGFRKISEPTLAIYLPDEKIATGAAVTICPGGGYEMGSYRLKCIVTPTEIRASF